MTTPARPLAPLGRLRAALGSLGLGLFLWVFALVIVGFAAYVAVNLRTTSEQWRQTVWASAQRFGDLINHATHHGMLLNRKEDVHHIIEQVQQAPGVRAVRIYDKQGVIIYSAEEGEIGRRVDLQAEACLICHDRRVPLTAVPTENRVRVFRNSAGERVLGLIQPIPNEPACYEAACHAHAPDQTVLGVLDVTMSMGPADASLAATRRLMIVAAVLIALLVGSGSAVFIDRLVRRPVARLIEGTQRIARGDLESRIDTGGGSEVGQLARSFNDMTDQLQEARSQITEWSRELERKVVEKTEELSRSQRQVLQMEKMASLGKLAATVAHELNNPLAGILNYAKLVGRSLREDERSTAQLEELQRYLGLVEKESARCGEIVRNLLLFARHSGAELALHHFNPLIQRALMLVQHHLDMAGVELSARLIEGDDQLVCDANQIQQALVALFVNAVEAMPNGGRLGVRADTSDGQLTVEVEDSGAGIPPEVLPQIFEPFFSTKNEAEGVGLGLAVVYGIVQRHGGRIEAESEVGRGTRMRVVLPRRPPAPAAHRAPTDRSAEPAPA